MFGVLSPGWGPAGPHSLVSGGRHSLELPHLRNGLDTTGASPRDTDAMVALRDLFAFPL